MKNEKKKTNTRMGRLKRIERFRRFKCRPCALWTPVGKNSMWEGEGRPTPRPRRKANPNTFSFSLSFSDSFWWCCLVSFFLGGVAFSFSFCVLLPPFSFFLWGCVPPLFSWWCCLVSCFFGWSCFFFTFLLRGVPILPSFGWGCVPPKKRRSNPRPRRKQKTRQLQDQEGNATPTN